jgi:hypothetical protein
MLYMCYKYKIVIRAYCPRFTSLLENQYISLNNTHGTVAPTVFCPTITIVCALITHLICTCGVCVCSCGTVALVVFFVAIDTHKRPFEYTSP